MTDNYLWARRRVGKLFLTVRIANQPGDRLWWLIDDSGIRHTSWVSIGSVNNGTAQGVKIVILSLVIMIGWPDSTGDQRRTSGN